MDHRGHLQLKANECYFYVLMTKSNEEHHNLSNAQVSAGSRVSVCACWCESEGVCFITP